MVVLLALALDHRVALSAVYWAGGLTNPGMQVGGGGVGGGRAPVQRVARHSRAHSSPLKPYIPRHPLPPHPPTPTPPHPSTMRKRKKLTAKKEITGGPNPLRAQSPPGSPRPASPVQRSQRPLSTFKVLHRTRSPAPSTPTHLQARPSQLLQRSARSALDVRSQLLHDRRALRRRQRPRRGLALRRPAGALGLIGLLLGRQVDGQVAQQGVHAVRGCRAQQVALQRGGGGFVIRKELRPMLLQLQPVQEKRQRSGKEVSLGNGMGQGKGLQRALSRAPAAAASAVGEGGRGKEEGMWKQLRAALHESLG